MPRRSFYSDEAGRKELNIWIFPGGSQGISFRATRTQLIASAWGSALLLVLVVYFASCLLLDLRLNTEASAVLNSEAIREAPVTERIKALANEVIEARAYKSQIEKRASHIENIIKEIESMELKLPKDSKDNSYPDTEQNAAVGGADEAAVPYYSARPMKRNASFQDRREEDFVERLDYIVDNLGNIPIGAPTFGRVTSGFGLRRSPFSGRRHFHSGLDISGPRGSDVLATASGIIVEAGWRKFYGYTVRIDHGNGFETVYGHLSKIAVQEGSAVSRGELIGLLGSTGRSTGPHVHYEVLVEGIAKDPMRYVQFAGLFRSLPAA